MNNKPSILPKNCKQTAKPAGEMANRSNTLLVIPSTPQGVVFFVFLVVTEMCVLEKVSSLGYTLENVYFLLMLFGLINYLLSELRNFIKIIKNYFNNKKIKENNNKLSDDKKIIKINLDKITKL